MPATIRMMFIIGLLFNPSFIYGQNENNYRKIKDSRGIEVKIPQKITKVITLDPFSTQLILTLKKQETLLAATVGTTIGNREKLTHFFPKITFWDDVFSGGNPNAEDIIKLKPDVVFAQKDRNNYKKIEEVGIPVVTLAVETLDDLMGSLILLGNMLGDEKRAEELKADVLKRIKQIQDSIPPKVTAQNVYFTGNSLLSSYGSLAWQSGILTMLKTTSPALQMKQVKIKINLEEFLNWNPDVIIVSAYCKESVADILSDKRYQQVKAIKNKRVYQIPRFILSWETPTLESLMGIYWLANHLYPEKFDLKTIIPELYKSYYSYTISDTELGSLLK